MIHKNKTCLGIRTASILLTLGIGLSASAQVNLSGSGTNYLQNFNALADGLPAGWTVNLSATVSSLGTASTLETNKTTWVSSTGQFANYASTVSNSGTNFLGSETTVQSTCTNRALAVRQIGTAGFDPGAAFVLQIANTTNRFNFRLNVDFLTLTVQARTSTWTIAYAKGVTPSSFVTLGTVEDGPVFGKNNMSFSLGSVLDDLSGPVWIRIAALSASTGSGSRDTFGIDNFSLSWSEASAPAVLPIPLNIELVGGAAVLTWTNAIFRLQAATEMGGSYTNISAATSPHTNLAVGDQMFFRLVHTNEVSGD